MIETSFNGTGSDYSLHQIHRSHGEFVHTFTVDGDVGIGNLDAPSFMPGGSHKKINADSEFEFVGQQLVVRDFQ